MFCGFKVEREKIFEPQKLRWYFFTYWKQVSFNKSKFKKIAILQTFFRRKPQKSKLTRRFT